MVTNEERKQVAARLREKHYERQGTFEPQSMGIQALNRLEDLLDCLQVRRTLFLDLADFIEPEPERTCKNLSTRKDGFACSVCECEVVGCMIDDFGSWDNPLLFCHCPNCGAKVVK